MMKMFRKFFSGIAAKIRVPKVTLISMICLSLLPAALIFYIINRFGVDVPFWDQWDYAVFFEKMQAGTLSFYDLFAQQNEYRQFFPNIIFVGLGAMSKWNVKYEMIVTFLLACLVSFNIFRLSCRTFGGSSLRRWSLFFLANLLIFSPLQWETWLFGVQIVYLVPAVCVTTCLVIVYSGLSARTKTLLCMALSVISTLSSVNGVICWFVVLPALLGMQQGIPIKNIWISVLWMLGLTSTLVVYFYGFSFPLYKATVLDGGTMIWQAFIYLLCVIGKPLGTGQLLAQYGSGPIIISAIVGALLSSLFFALAVYVFRNSSDRGLIRDTMGWFMLGAYSLLTALMVTFGRQGYGLMPALSSRYMSYTLYLVVALIFLVPIIRDHYFRGDTRHPYRYGVYLLLGLLMFTQYICYYGGTISAQNCHRVRLKRKAGLLFINYISQDAVDIKIYPDNPGELKKMANFLDEIGYIKPGLMKSNDIRQIESSQDSIINCGTIESVVKVSDNEYLVSGRANLPGRKRPADAVLFTYEKNDGTSVIFAIAYTDLRKTSWNKTLLLKSPPKGPMTITTWSFNANKGEAYKHKGKIVITRI
jgi:hypothetical protein